MEGDGKGRAAGRTDEGGEGGNLIRQVTILQNGGRVCRAAGGTLRAVAPRLPSFGSRGGVAGTPSSGDALSRPAENSGLEGDDSYAWRAHTHTHMLKCTQNVRR